MKIKVLKNSEELGKEAAKLTAELLNQAVKDKGSARIILSTGASQFGTLKELAKADVNWSKVEMFHLDEYVGLPESHPASFRKYLKERFINLIKLKEIHLVNGEGAVQESIRQLSEEISKEPVDVALIGIGENAHIAFNDPPADFDTRDAYIVVNLDDKCKMQQVGEGWFPTINDVPSQAISMSVYQIMQSKVIISSVPYKVKANAVKLTLENDLTYMVPATMLKEHENFNLFLDEDSAVLADKEILSKYE